VSLAVGVEADELLTVSGVDAQTAALGIDALDIATAPTARESLDPLDAALDRIQSLTARFGGAENRLDSLSRFLAARIESTSAAESRIRDLDFAEETARRLRDRILQESALALLGQNRAALGAMLRLLV
jgi:flagellin